MATNVEIGVKTGQFSAGLARMQADWNKFKGQVQKKFSLGDLGKSTMQALGIGSVGGIAQVVTNMFEMAADSARVMYERTAGTLNVTKQLIGLRQDPAQQIKSAEKDLYGQEREIERQRKLVADLDGVLKYSSPAHATLFAAANEELTAMLDKLGQSRVAIEQMKIAEQHRRETLKEQSAAIIDQRALLKGKISEEDVARRAASRAAGREFDMRKLPGGEERALARDQANLAVERAAEARRMAQMRSIKADSLARIGGGGGVYAPSGERTNVANPAQAMVTEARKSNALLKSIDGKLGTKFVSPATTLK